MSLYAEDHNHGPKFRPAPANENAGEVWRILRVQIQLALIPHQVFRSDST